MTLEDEVARLRAENAELRTLVAQLQEQLSAALARIAELEQQRRDPPSFVTPNTPKPTEPKPPRKKRARQHNRARSCETPTRIVEHALDRCPDCHYRLRGHSLDYSRQVLELPPPPPIEAIEHRVIKRFCPNCTRWRSPKLDLSGQVFGRSRIGVRLASLLAYLRTTLRLPIAALRRYLASLHHLKLSEGGIQEILHDVRQAVAPALATIKQHVQHAGILHGDETSWRANGQSGIVPRPDVLTASRQASERADIPTDPGYTPIYCRAWRAKTGPGLNSPGPSGASPIPAHARPRSRATSR